MKERDKGCVYVKGMKYNLLSVSQMCSKGYNLTFHDRGCEIKKGNTSKLVVEGTRTDGNVQSLKGG